jgi:hypothetical protein
MQVDADMCLIPFLVDDSMVSLCTALLCASLFAYMWDGCERVWARS